MHLPESLGAGIHSQFAAPLSSRGSKVHSARLILRTTTSLLSLSIFQPVISSLSPFVNVHVSSSTNHFGPTWSSNVCSFTFTVTNTPGALQVPPRLRCLISSTTPLSLIREVSSYFTFVWTGGAALC